MIVHVLPCTALLRLSSRDALDDTVGMQERIGFFSRVRGARGSVAVGLGELCGELYSTASGYPRRARGRQDE